LAIKKVKIQVKNHITKITRLHKRDSLKSARFKRTNLVIFVIIFASIAGYLVYSSFAATITPPPAPVSSGNVWQLNFDEEFDGTDYDHNKFTPCFDWNFGDCTYSFNNGYEKYDPAQITVSGGFARFKAEPMSPTIANSACYQGVCRYKAGLLATSRKNGGDPATSYLYTFKYGYAEASLKIPAGQGFYTSWWMLPAATDFNYPYEIDTLETLGHDVNTMYMTYHYNNRTTEYTPNNTTGKNGVCADLDYSQAFHRFGVDWEPTFIAWYIDGVKCGQFNGTAGGTIAAVPMQLIINQQVSMNWQQSIGKPLLDLTLSSNFDIDYIRVWQQVPGTPDTQAPTVSLTAPTAGSTVSGSSVALSANASDNVGVSGVQFKVDGSNVGSQDTTSPYSVTWNSTGVANGSHTITAVASDAAGNSTTSSSVSVTVSNAPDTTPPTVSLTAPTTGSTVSGASVAVAANAADNVGVAGVQFKLDGSNLQAEDTTSPYSINWDSTAASNGTHTLTAIARDGAGNSTTSAAVSVTLNNVATNLNIGETNILASDDSGNGNMLLAQQTSLGQTATIQSMSFYVATASGKLRLGIYDASGPSGGPGAKKAETAEITPVTGWNTANVTTPVSLSAGTYWLAYFPNDNNLHFRLDTSSGTHRFYSLTYTTMPATFSTTPTTGAGHWSLYASLVSGAAGPKSGDINGDNSVNITDLSLLLSSYGQSTTQCSTNNAYKCDLSSPGDGVVNIFDLSILLSKYGT
jgi:beta-glucanase (GH16 family)